MGDEKVPAEAKKDDKAPVVTKPPGPEQQTGPGRASEKKAKDEKKTEEKKPDEKKPEEKKPAAGAVPEPSTPPKQAAEQATQLQQSVGNQEANRLMRAAREAPGAPALPVSHPDDKAEKEAEAVAKKVTEERPAHPHDNPAPAPGDPKATHGDPQEVTGDPAQERGTVHRAARKTPQAPQPPPAGGQTKGQKADSPTAALENPGPGEKIPQPTRGILERRLNVNLNHVVIHHDAKADAAVRALHARAVTRGNHIWLASDASPTDLNLMAHEVAHVLQHDNHVVHRKPADVGAAPVQRQGDSPTPAGSGTKTTLTLPDELDDAEKTKYKGPKGTINTTGPTLELDEVFVPEFKVKLQKKYPLRWNPAQRGETYRATWAAAAAAKLQGPITQRASETDQKTEPFYFEATGGVLVFGTAADIGNALSTIPWDKSGKNRGKKKNKKTEYQIDHQHEYAIGGAENDINNLWLLDPAVNTGSGSVIKSSVTADVKAFLRGAAPKLANPPADEKDVKGKYALTFKNAIAGPNPRQDPTSDVWTRKLTEADSWALDELAQPSAAKPLREMAPKNREKIEGTKSTLSISTRRGGGRSGTQSVSYNASSGKIEVKELFLKGAYKVVSGTYTGGDSPHPPGQNVGSLLVIFFPGNGELTEAERTFPIVSASGVKYGGLIDTGAIRELGKQLRHKKMSPVELTAAEFDFEHGLVGRGIIPTPSIKLLQNVQLGVVIEGNDVGLEAVISGGELKLPGPFKVNDGSLTLSATTGGFSVDGRIDFEIEKLAKGYIEASASSKDKAAGFELDGKLMFDTKMFTKADLGLSYKKGKWGVSGELAVGPDKIKGIKSASAKVDVEDETVTASGEFETTIKGIEKGSLGFKYQEAAGMEITGEIQFGKGIPGIQSGKLDATVAKTPEGKWSLSAKGSATPNIPGVDATLSASYEDGVFTIEGQAAYAKGKLSGTLQVGVTNKPLSPEGKPGEGKPGNTLRAYGGGTVTIKVTPWLQGTVGVVLKPEGGVKLSGEIALPDAVDLFPRKEINKNILTIGVDIPIIGVAVAGQRVGIFATVQGGLDAFAGVGPGQLTQLGLKIEYDPDHEEDTSITGTAKLQVPANAGIRLFVKGGVGVGIPIVSAEAGLEVGGSLALEGAVEAGVTVNWTPSKGLKIDAEASVHAEPKLKFDVSAYVKVAADLLLTSVTLYENKWQLAAVEYGSGLRVGIRAPVRYEEGKPFEFDASKVEFEVPKIDPLQVIGGLVKQITGG